MIPIPLELIELYDNTITLANNHNVNVIMHLQDEVLLNGGEYNGYFIQNPPTFAVACGQSEDIWVPVFIHESCHMDQWIEQSPYWINAHLGNIEALDLIMLWVDDKISLNDKQRNTIIGKARDLELDCERRTVEKIKKYNIPLNIPEYIQKSNAYIYFYNILGETKRWYTTDNEPYILKEIWEKMPNNFDGIYDTTPEEIRNVFKPWFPELE